jgi:addiction module RelB/DinJ family antitoxin
MKTVLTIKTDKSVRDEARKVAEEFGIPLGTIINAFLRQFVRSKELSLDLSYRPSKYLRDVIKQSEIEFEKGDYSGPFNGVEELMTHLNSL